MENLISEWSLWLYMRSNRPATIEYHRDYLLRIQRNLLLKPEDYSDRDTVRKAYEKLWKLDIANNTRKKYLITMRMFADFLIDKGIIDVNYPRELKTPKVQKALPFSMNRKCFAQIYNAIYRRWGDGMLGTRNKMIFDAFIYTGLRREELTKVLRSDVDGRKILVREGKGGKTRSIFLPGHFAIDLQKYMKETEGVSDYLFYSDRKRGSKLHPVTISTTFQRIAAFAGMRVYPHLLRHTYASNCIIDGVDIYTVQQQLGHSDVSTTSLYLYLDDDQRYKNMQKLK